MPLYNFECKRCGVIGERLVNLNATEKHCECGYIAKKIFSPNKTIFQVNGAGAYNNTMKTK